MADRRTDAAKDRARTGRQTTDELFNDEYARAGIQPFNVVVDRSQERATRETAEAEAEEQMALEEMVAYEQARQAYGVQQQAAQLQTPDGVAEDGAGSGVTSTLANRSVFFWMMGWHWWQWTTLQLVLGLLSVMFFGLAYSLESTWIGRRISDVASAVNTVTSFVGFDFSRFSPENMFWVLYIFLLGIMWLSIFATVVVYMCVQNKALSGKGVGLKYGTIALAVIGYAVPVANLFPWIFFYILVMARYPK
jgi:hypothetical protein